MTYNVLFASSGYFDTIKLQNMICWEDINCKFTSCTHRILDFGRKGDVKPDILILNYGLISSDIFHYINLIRQEKLNTQIILFTTQSVDDSDYIEEYELTVINWDVFTSMHLKHAIENAIIEYNRIEENNKQYIKDDIILISNQQLQDLVGKADVFCFVRLVLHLPYIDEKYLFQLYAEVEKILSNLLTGQIVIIQNNILFCIDYSSAFVSNENNSELEYCMQCILWHANKKHPGSGFLLISQPTMPASKQQAYNELSNLEQYHYFCREVPLLTMEYVRIYQKTSKLDDQGALVYSLLTAILNGNTGEVDKKLESIYLYRIKPSMNFKLLQFYRKEINNCLETVARFKQISLANFKMDQEYSTLEDELSESRKKCKYFTEANAKGQKEFPILIVNTLTIIAREYGQPISLSELAMMQQVSKSYLGRVFRKTMGMVLVDYLQRVRIDAAKELMICGHRQIAEIAVETGFSDPAYFSRVFKKSEGTSPTKYINNL